MKKFQSILALMLCIFLLCGCHNDENPATSDSPSSATTLAPSTETNYTVTVLGANGEPISESIIVHFIQDGQTVAMQPLNAQGVAQKVLPTGDYTVELDFADGDLAYCYDDSNLKLDADNVSLSIVMYGSLSDQNQELSAYSESAGEYRSYTAHYISTGYTFMSLDTGDRNYVLFMPTQSGMYEFSVSGDASVGYYGMPHYVQSFNLAEMTDEGTFTINITPGMIGSFETSGSTVLVLGIDSNDQTDCVISIQRIGDYVPTIEDLPWDIYQTTAALNPFKLPDDISVEDFDLTASSDAYTLVLNEKDGFYHLGSADGPIIFAKLGVSTLYLDSIETVLESSGIAKYYFDENDVCIRKESYSECLLEYIANMDEATGLYPLTQDLVYIFQSRGEYVGWWDQQSPMYLFKDDDGKLIPGINHDIAWLFLCCYSTTSIDLPDVGPENPCANGHVEVTDAGKKPTCTADGLTDGKHCSVCGAVTAPQQTVPATGHTEVTDKGKAATCTSTGLTDGKHCSVCDLVITAQQTIAATGHNYGQWVEAKAPTTEATGIAERTCSGCGKKEQKTLDKLEPEDPCANGHTVVTDTGKVATCTESGLTEGKHCSVCGSVIVEQKEIPSTGHHEVTDAGKAATCMDAGLTEGKHCSVCGIVTLSQQTVNATGHHYGDWVVVKAPTTEATGTAERTCSNCGSKEQKMLDQLENITQVVGIAANADAHIELFGTEALKFTADVEPGTYVWYDLWRVSGSVLTVHGDYAYVIYGGKTYWPVNGVVEVELSGDNWSAIQVAIGNAGSKAHAIGVECVYPLGTYNNPETLVLGSFTTQLEKGNDQGYYYTFVAQSSGTLTITLDSLNVNANCDITLQSLDPERGDGYQVSTSGTVSIQVSAGEEIRINIGVYTDNYEYPAATVKATAIFE